MKIWDYTITQGAESQSGLNMMPVHKKEKLYKAKLATPKKNSKESPFLVMLSFLSDS